MSNTLIKSIVLICFAFKANSQALPIYFGYDAAGNRITRSVTLQSMSSLNNSRKSISDSSSINSDMDGFSVTVHPNPTRGIVVIEIQNLPKDSVSSFTIADMNGKIIQNQKITSNKVETDLNYQSTGLYIMNILIGRKKQLWKIIKE